MTGLPGRGDEEGSVDYAPSLSPVASICQATRLALGKLKNGNIMHRQAQFPPGVHLGDAGQASDFQPPG